MADTPEEDLIAPGSETEAAAELSSSGKKTIGLAALAIMVVHFLAKIGGFVQKKVLAHFFGTDVAADAATGMEKIFQTIYYIPEELLTHSLLPVFTRVRNEDGEAAAWRMASLTGTLQALLLVLVSGLAIAFAPALTNAYLGRPDPLLAASSPLEYAEAVEKLALAARLVRVAMIGLFCTSIGSLTYVLLNAYKRFVTPALGDVAQKAGIVIGTVVVCVGFKDLGPLGYAIGFILGGVFKLLTHLLALRGQLHMVRPGIDLQDPALRELGRLMVPLLGGSVTSKGRDVLLNRIAWRWSERVPGTIAALDYAQKIVWMPVQVVPYALGLALFPFLADWAQQQDRKRVTEAFLGASRMMLFVFVPLTVGCVLLGREVITVLYKSGKFQEGSVDLTMGPFIIFALGLVFYALEMIANQVYYAHRDTKTPFWLGLIGSGVHITVAWWLGLQMQLGAAGIAAGFAIGKTVKVLLMWWRLGPRLDGYQFPALAALLAKIAVGCVVMGAAIVGCKQVASQLLDLGSAKQAALFLMGTSVVAIAIFFAAAVILKIDELHLLLTQVKAKLKRRKKAAE